MQEFTQKDLDDLLSYIKHLEGQVEELKATAITVVQQRNAAMGKLKEITSKLHKPLVESATLDVDYSLENPEQYKEVKQF
jgi:transglutaminase/protease-like cytokinesis protein 3